LKAAEELNIKQVAVAGGVSANSGLRQAFHHYAEKYGWEIFIPPFAFTTDNAAMIAITGYYKYLRGEFSSLEDVPYARVSNLLV
jgi:N6-L-threonylcarbamoyladenine synthase